MPQQQPSHEKKLKTIPYCFIFSSLILIVLLSFAPPRAQAQANPDEQALLNALNQARSDQYGQPVLSSDPRLNDVAQALLEGIAADCTFTAGSDQQIAQNIGYIGAIEVMRLCGINLSLEVAIGDMTSRISTVSNTPLISQGRFAAVGVGSSQEASASGAPLLRYVVVLGTEAPAAPEAVAPIDPSSISLSQAQKLSSLNLLLDYPAGWTAIETDPRRLAIVERADDLPSVTDNNPATRANGGYITLDMIPLRALGLDPNHARLDSIEGLIIDILGLQSESRFEQAILGQRSITHFALDANSNYGLITFWVAGDDLVILVYGGANRANVAAMSEVWKAVLNSLRPVDSLPLTEQIISTYTSLSFTYPNGWTNFNGTDQFFIFARSSDRDAWVAGFTEAIQDAFITTTYQSLNELQAAGFLPNATLEEALELTTTALQLSNIRVTDAIVMGEAALWLRSVDAFGFHSLGVLGYVNDHLYFIRATAPNPERLSSFEPTFLLMVEQLRAP